VSNVLEMAIAVALPGAREDPGWARSPLDPAAADAVSLVKGQGPAGAAPGPV